MRNDKSWTAANSAGNCVTSFTGGCQVSRWPSTPCPYKSMSIESSWSMHQQTAPRSGASMWSDGPSGRKSHGRPDSRIFAAALASRACRKANERCATTTPCSLAERNQCSSRGGPFRRAAWRRSTALARRHRIHPRERNVRTRAPVVKPSAAFSGKTPEAPLPLDLRGPTHQHRHDDGQCMVRHNRPLSTRRSCPCAVPRITRSCRRAATAFLTHLVRGRVGARLLSSAGRGGPAPPPSEPHHCIDRRVRGDGHRRGAARDARCERRDAKTRSRSAAAP